MVDLSRFVQRIAAAACTGLAFTPDGYAAERYLDILHEAASISSRSAKLHCQKHMAISDLRWATSTISSKLIRSKSMPQPGWRLSTTPRTPTKISNITRRSCRICTRNSAPSPSVPAFSPPPPRAITIPRKATFSRTRNPKPDGYGATELFRLRSVAVSRPTSLHRSCKAACTGLSAPIPDVRVVQNRLTSTFWLPSCVLTKPPRKPALALVASLVS
ncbi:MAG: NUDIX hydrolase N-terminal domain-containing protein [Candidatus Binataceae bacterium]|nr:NUDIX hydrolase N-terminal domain-containing protein [Candidatus Binataceae bacterium]